MQMGLFLLLLTESEVLAYRVPPVTEHEYLHTELVFLSEGKREINVQHISCMFFFLHVLR